MKLRQMFKKFAAITLAGAVVVLSANALSVHAQSISDISVGKPGWGLVSTETGSGLKVRSTPSLESGNVITTLPYNSRVMVVGESGDFYKVQYDVYGHYGYVFSEFLMLQSSPYYLRANTNSSPLNLREAPDSNSERLARIPKGTGFAYVGFSNNWYEGVYGNQSGYTTSQYTGLYRY